MNTRRKYIVYILNHHDEMSIFSLAEMFDVSVRTIRNDIEKINDLLNGGYKNNLYVKSGVIEIERKDVLKDLLDEYDTEDFYFNILTPKERQHLILLDLLMTNKPMIIDDFVNKYFVTRNIILSDMDSIRQQLKSNEVELSSKRGYGYWIEIDELKRRALITKIFRDRKPKYEIENIDQSLFSNIQFNTRIFDKIDISQIIEIVRETEIKLQFELSEIAVESLTFHLALAIQRNLERDTKNDLDGIEFEIDVSEDSIQYLFSKNVIDLVKERFDEVLPDVELKYIALHVHGREQVQEDNLRFSEDMNLRLILIKLIRSFEIELNSNFSKNHELLRGLMVHIQSSMVRYKNNITLENPILEKIEADYEYLFDILAKHIGTLESYIGNRLNKNEMSYLVIYFAAAIERTQNTIYRQINTLVVCGSGYGTAQLVKGQIERYFSNINIVATTSAYRIESLIKENDIDFIVATTKITDKYNLPIVNVRPIFQREDRAKIAEIIDEISVTIAAPKSNYGINASLKYEVNQILLQSTNDNQVINDLKKLISKIERKTQPLMLSDLLFKDYIVMNVECKNWEDAIRISGEPLVKDGVCNEQYIQDCIDAVNELGPYIVITKHVAIPHAVNSGNVQKAAISLATLSTPVKFGNSENDPVKYVFMLATKDGNAHLGALTDLVELLSSKKFLSVIDTAQSAEEIADAEMKTFRTLNSRLQGHPYTGDIPEVDATTGMLGQGLSIGVGIALAKKANNDNHHTYVIVGDGELHEGQIWEAAQQAASFKLSNLVLIVDYNGLSSAAPVNSVLNLYSIKEKFEAFQFNVVEIDGHNMNEIIEVLEIVKENKEKPLCIIAHTIKGKGVSYMENIPKWHSSPISDEERDIAMADLDKIEREI